MTQYLTPEQDAEFDGYIAKWQAILGLNDWRGGGKGKRGARDAMAQVNVRMGPRLAVYTTGNWGLEPATAKSLEATAVHELLHVFLADLTHAVRRDADETTLDS